jgi:hypothetical protein
MDVDQFIVAHLHQQFVEDGNPLHAWQAYQLSRRRRVPTILPDGELGLMVCEPLPVPAWVAEYFDQSAEALLSGMPPNRALKLKVRGGHSKFRQLANDSRDVGIVSYVGFCMSLTSDDVTKDVRRSDWLFAPLLRGESKLDRICEHVAEETRRKGIRFSNTPLSAKTIRDLYFRLK